MDLKKMFWKLEVQLFPKSIMYIYEICLPQAANRAWFFQGLKMYLFWENQWISNLEPWFYWSGPWENDLPPWKQKGHVPIVVSEKTSPGAGWKWTMRKRSSSSSRSETRQVTSHAIVVPEKTSPGAGWKCTMRKRSPALKANRPRPNSCAGED